MLFLGWFVTDWLSQVPATLYGAIIKGVKTVFFFLDTIVYRLIINLYDMFVSLCTVRLLDNDIIKAISDRIGLVLGVVMLFLVILSFIKMLIDPDTVSDKEKGAVSVIKKAILVIVMLGVSNFVFSALYNVQKVVIESNVIAKLLIPYKFEITINGQETTDTEAIMDNKKFGVLLAEELLMSFYRLEEFDESVEMSSEDANTYAACQTTVNAFRTQIINYKRFDLGYNCLNEDVTVLFKVDNSNSSTPQETSIVDFNWLLSAVCGIAMVYFLFIYCLKIGVRMVQLMFLEIISPLAIVSQLSPKKETMFSKWGSMYFATYIDVFIRVAIINFVFFLISTLFSTNGATGLKFSETFASTDSYTRSFFVVVIMFALLTFAKKAPELLKSLLPESVSKLGFGASMKDIVGLEKSVGTLAGAATGAAVGFLGGKGIGALGGVFRGARAGFGAKGAGAAFGAARKAQAEHNQLVRQGAYSGLLNSFLTNVGASTPKERYDKQISDLEESIQKEKVSTAQMRRKSAAYGQVTTAKGNIEDRAEKKLFSKSIDATKHAEMAKKQRELLALRAKVDTLKNSGANENVIASAERSYFSKLDETKKSYITYAMKHSDFDAGMTAMFGDLKNTVQINADGAFNDMTFETNSYDDLDQFETSTTTKNNVLSREIAVSDAKIQGIENTIQSVKNEPGYINSHKIK